MKNADSSHDFGKDIIPALLNDEKKLCAYKYKGYWKDVGTIDSLWEANMDLLDKNNALDLNDPAWKIYTEDVTALPQYIGADAVVDRAFITQGCVVNGKVKNSVLFTGAKVAEGAQVIEQCSLWPGAEVGRRSCRLHARSLQTVSRSVKTPLSEALTARISNLWQNV